MASENSVAKSLRGACSIFLQDLEALPEEAIAKQFAPSARTVADIVCEVNMVNDHVTMTVRGEEPFEWPDEGWIKAPAEFIAKAAVIDAFKASSERAMATFDAFSEEDLARSVTTEHGERTIADRARFMTLHLWYHSGQLNFIQTLLGDTEWHWK